MLFSSLVFLFLFLPAVILLHVAVPKVGKNLILLLASLLFYAWGGVTYLLVLILSILLNHALAIAIGKQSGKAKKTFLITGIILNVGILATFKYLDFIVINLNGILSAFGLELSITEPGIHLPLGISFFTFQQMSMLWDIYRQEKTERLRLMDTALYVSFFPQLIAGPIVRYHDIIDQIRNRVADLPLMRSGVQRFTLGLLKKVVIANTCAELADSIILLDPSESNAGLAWFAISVFALQVYYDFAGYSDMAIGLGRMCGFRILENFNFPYLSLSMQEFWQRWHISLSTWFKDYLYIPLGGNRLGATRTYINLLTIFFLTGLWHGATWNFVVWGMFHGSFLLLERAGLAKILTQIPKPFAWVYTTGVVVVACVFFRLEFFSDSLTYLSNMIGLGEGISNLSPIDYLNPEYAIVLTIAILGCTKFFEKIKNGLLRIHDNGSLLVQTTFEFARTGALLAAILLCATLINAGSYSPFIYFRF